MGTCRRDAQLRGGNDVAVGVARYDDLLRPVADGRPDGFCKLIADRQSHHILGAHVLGEYWRDRTSGGHGHERRDDR